MKIPSILQQQLIKMGNSQTIQQFPKNYIETKREQHSIFGNISYIFNKEANKKYILCQRTFMIQNQYESYFKKLKHRKQLASSGQNNYNHNRVNKVNKHLINIMQIKCSEYSQLCGRTFKIHIFIQQFQSDLKKQFNQRRFKNLWFSQKDISEILHNVVNSLIVLYDNNIKSYHLSLDSIVSINGIYKIIDSDLTSKPLPIYDFIHQSKLKKGTYLSPEHLQLQRQTLKGIQYYYQNPKSDIFTLGILILELMSLEDMFQAYDYQQKKICFQVIEKCIRHLEARYSSKIIQIVREMVMQVEGQRIGLLGLKQMIQGKEQPKNTNGEKQPQLRTEPQNIYLNTQTQKLQSYRTNGGNALNLAKTSNMVKTQSNLSEYSSNYNKKRKSSTNELNYHPLYNNKHLLNKQKNQHNQGRQSQEQQNNNKNRSQSIGSITSKSKIKPNQQISHNANKDYSISHSFKNQQSMEGSDRITVNKSYSKDKDKGKGKEVGQNQIWQNDRNGFQREQNMISGQYYKFNSSAMSHSSDLPVSPITNINIKGTQQNNQIHANKNKHHGFEHANHGFEHANRVSNGNGNNNRLYQPNNNNGSKMQQNGSKMQQNGQNNKVKHDYQFIQKGSSKSLNTQNNYTFEQRTLRNYQHTNTKDIYKEKSGEYYHHFNNGKQQLQSQSNYIKTNIQLPTTHQLPGTHQLPTTYQLPNYQRKPQHTLANQQLNSNSFQNYKKQFKSTNNHKQYFNYRNLEIAQVQQTGKVQAIISLQTPRNNNHNRKNIYSINTVKYQQKQHQLIDSSRSTPVKYLELIQTNKKEYQEMSKTTFGRYDFSNGAVYEGQFNQNNQFQGNGVLYYPNGKICYSGGWFQNCFHSFGVLYNQQIITQTPTTHKHTNYKDFNQNDSNNWIQYEGEFVQDKKNGFGSLLMSNGDKFSGCFVNDVIEGFGTFCIKSTGETINGIWLNNLLQK